MIKSVDLLNKIKEILDKEEISEKDLNSLEHLTLNKYKLNGKESDINLSELYLFKNLRTLTLINFSINKDFINIINEFKFLWAIQFSSCNFEDVVPINQSVSQLIFDYCKNFKSELINNNKIIRIIGSKIDLKQLNKLDNTKELYLQNCNVRNTEEILKYNKLELLNLDGSNVENDNILDKLDKRIRVYFKDEYHPVGGV